MKERNEGKITSFWKFRIGIIFRLWAKKICSTFAGVVTAGLSKIRCTCSDEGSYKEIFWKAYYFFFFSKNPALFFQSFDEKISAGWSYLLLYMYIGTFLGNLFSLGKVQSFFPGFRNLSCKCVDSQRKLFATIVKIAFSVAKESILMKKKFVQKIVTSTFLEFGKVFRFLATKLRQACQNFIVHVRRTFWGETTLLGRRPNFSSFPEFEQTFFRI